MKSLNTITKISCAMLGLGISISAHAFHIECGDVFGPKDSGKVIKLDRNLFCNSEKDNPDFAIQISGENITFLLNGHSIKADPDFPPVAGIYITGDNNEVKGPGKVEEFGISDIPPVADIYITGDNNEVKGPGKVDGFGITELGVDFGGNIFIENANDNRISQLKINGGNFGVGIFGNNDNLSANRNHVTENLIRAPRDQGILLSASTAGTTRKNHISSNIVRNADPGIEVFSQDLNSRADKNEIYLNVIAAPERNEPTGITVGTRAGATANSNEIYTNTLQNVEFGIGVSSSGLSNILFNNIYLNRIQASGIGIFLVSNNSGSRVNGNRVNDNRIEYPQFGIVLAGNLNGVSNRNFLLKNRIIRPIFAAINVSGGLGGTSSNLITNNMAEDTQMGIVYCDNNTGSNTWQINFENFIPRIGDPNTNCPL